MDFKTGIANAEKYLLPAALAATALIPGLPVGVVAVVTAIPKLMEAYQAVFPAGSGTVKLAGVMGAVQASCDVLDTTLTGGAKGSFDKIAPIATSLINTTITTINATANMNDAQIEAAYLAAKATMLADDPANIPG